MDLSRHPGHCKHTHRGQQQQGLTDQMLFKYLHKHFWGFVGQISLGKAEGYYQNIGILASSSQSHLSWGFVSSQKGLMELCSGSRQCRTCCLRGCQWGPEMTDLWIKHLKGDVRASALPGLSSSLAVAFVQTQEAYISHSTSSFIHIKQLLSPGSISLCWMCFFSPSSFRYGWTNCF